MVSTVPLWEASVPQHSGRVHSPSLLAGVQCPDRASTLYLPEISLAWEVAFSTSQGEEPHDVKIGWHLVSPRYSILKYLREERELALVLRVPSQYSKTPAFAAFFTCSLVGLEDSQYMGWGRPYCRHSFLILQNQDLELELPLEKT